MHLKADTDQGKEQCLREELERGLQFSDESYASGKVTCCTLYFRVCEFRAAEQAGTLHSLCTESLSLLAEK